MPFPSAAATADKWQARGAASQQAFVDGVNGTQKDPTALAAAQAQKMLTGVTNAVTSGYWARRLAEVGKGGWQAATVAKAANFVTGINAAKTKYQTGIQDFWNYMTPTLSQIDSMPKNSIADSIARATLWIQTAAGYQKP